MSQENDIKQLIKEAKESIVNFDEKAAEKVAIDALKMGLDINEFVEKGFLEGMKAVGDMFEEGNACLLHIFAASNAMKAGMAVIEGSDRYRKANDSMAIELITDGERDDKIKVLEAMFKINGYDVVEIPGNVPILDYLEKDGEFLDIPSSCKEEIKAAQAANPDVTTFQLCVI